MNFLIFGPPGSGKGTYSTRLEIDLKMTAIAMGDVFRDAIKQGTALGKKVESYLKSGQLVPDDVVVEVLEKKIHEKEDTTGFILDGFPRTIQQAKALEKISKIDAVINLQVPERIIIARLSSRRICKNCGAIYNVLYLKPKKEGTCDVCGGPLYQREDDTEKVIRDRIKVYEKQTQPLLEYYKGRVPFVNFRCEKLDMPPEKAVVKILEGLRRIGLYDK
ncbi:MAG TPA: nucleoside monophosphate kinase [Candidatus Bathyarchaeia archaeon]|nr:nucleoside monophosphate kinase [Candidatus Bathyarchaeia archaeon]